MVTEKVANPIGTRGVHAHIERVSDDYPDGRQILKDFLAHWDCLVRCLDVQGEMMKKQTSFGTEKRYRWLNTLYIVYIL